MTDIRYILSFTLCDPSEKMLAEAKVKLAGRDIRFFNISSQQITFESEFDVVTAVQMHLNRRGIEVFPITIEEHIRLLRECGFRSVDLIWTSYLQAGFWAVK